MSIEVDTPKQAPDEKNAPEITEEERDKLRKAGNINVIKKERRGLEEYYKVTDAENRIAKVERQKQNKKPKKQNQQT